MTQNNRPSVSSPRRDESRRDEQINEVIRRRDDVIRSNATTTVQRYSLISSEYRYKPGGEVAGGNFGGEQMNCQECDGPLVLPSDAIQGEIVSCGDCGASYELVRSANPELFTLRAAELEEEDWGE